MKKKEKTMRRREKRLPFIETEEALAKFTEMRREVNNCVEREPEKFPELWEEIKQKALYDSVIAMDVLAYFYKTGIPKLLPENYERHVAWQFLSAARGNKLALDKIQFLITHAVDQIAEHEKFDDMVYLNDITEENINHVLGKALCKVLVGDFLKAFPIDLVKLKDEYVPYSQEAFINLRKMIDDAVPLTQKFLLS